MEVRIIVALMLAALAALGLCWIGVRYFARRRVFKLRQLGRGKQTTVDHKTAKNRKLLCRLNAPVEIFF